jgi:outer membrane receptor for monomeric catechols
MSASLVRTVAAIAVCFLSGTFALAGERPRDLHAKQHAARSLQADRDPYADPAAPYKADRLSWSRGEQILNTPGQTTVLTRQVLDDMNATSLRDAMRATAGVTVGR